MQLEDFVGNSVDVLREARKALGSSEAVTAWLNSPLPNHENKTPAELLETTEGYRLVLDLLKERI